MPVHQHRRRHHHCRAGVGPGQLRLHHAGQRAAVCRARDREAAAGAGAGGGQHEAAAHCRHRGGATDVKRRCHRRRRLLYTRKRRKSHSKRKQKRKCEHGRAGDCSPGSANAIAEPGTVEYWRGETLRAASSLMSRKLYTYNSNARNMCPFGPSTKPRIAPNDPPSRAPHLQHFNPATTQFPSATGPNNLGKQHIKPK